MQKAIYRYILNLLFLLLLIVLWKNSYSQFTPARGTFVITPPYPNKLSDYGNPNLLKMNATITATDPSFTSKPIRLKLSIFYNQQLLMQGNDMVVGERPMYLTMGQMLILTQADLAPYFQQQNMRVSPVQYSQTLREGFYQFQLDILDYYTLQKIGLPLVASIYIMRYDPPQLYKPENKAILMDKGQGLVQFQWQPRQIAPNTEYEFTIVELQQEKFVDPAIEFTARKDGSYYYKTTTRMNTLNYGMMGEMPLRWGKSYAWQVRAVTREGIDQVGTYEQDGYTDIRSFTYQKYCPVPTNISVDVKSSEEATYTWDAAPEHTSYILKITAADNPENTWLSVYPQEAKFEEKQYRPDITYFYKLQGVCGEAKSEESGERSFTMLPKGQIKNFKCNEGDGKESTGFETIANQKLLERDLRVGDTFTYSNWCKIAVKSVEKVGGYYRGKGVYRFPLAMFGFPLINIIFDSITVNTDLVALSGGFDAVNRGMAGVADIDDAMNIGKNLVSGVSSIVTEAIEKLNNVNNKIQEILKDTSLSAEEKNTAYEEQKKELENIVKNLDVGDNQRDKALESLQELPNNINTPYAQTAVAREIESAARALADEDIAITGENKNAYFIINGKKYVYGDTVYMPEGEYSIKAYRNKDSLYSSNSTWMPSNIVTNNILSSEKIKGYQIHLIVKDTALKDSLKCLLVLPIVREKNEKITIPYDDNQIKYYPSFDSEKIIVGLKTNDKGIVPMTSGFPLSLQTGKNGSSINSISPEKILIKKSHGVEDITLTANSMANEYSEVYFNNEKALDKLYSFKVINYPTNDMKRKVQMVLVEDIKKSEKLNKYSFNGLEKSLNKIYNPVGISFTINQEIKTIKLDYDKNGDGLLDKSTDGDDWNKEAQMLQDSTLLSNKFNTSVADYDYLVLVVNKIKSDKVDKVALGFARMSNDNSPKNYRTVFVGMDEHYSAIDLYETIAHEIGHAGFKLKHPFEQFKGIHQEGDDQFNFMDYGIKAIGQKISRAYQWKQIFENDLIKNKENEKNK